MSDNIVAKQQKSFLDLAPELRNIIYDGSGCLVVLQCPCCSAYVYGSDIEDHICPNFKLYQVNHLKDRNEIEKFRATRVVVGKGRYFEKGWKFDKEAVMKHGLFKPASLGIDHTYARQPALTKVHSIIRAETLPMFHASNRFVAFLPRQLISWFKVIGPSSVRWLRKLSIWANYEAEDELLEKLKGLGLNLEKCKVEVEKW